MKRIGSLEILKWIEARETRGHRVDARLIGAVKAAISLSLFTIHDEASFLSLVWQEIDDSRLLTPLGQSRTLADVAARIVANRWTIDSLSRPMGLPQSEHRPGWFEPCVTINSEFNFEDFDFVGLVAANDSERRQSPRGTFYIYDGAHKTLVLAHRLLTKQTAFHSTEGLLITPRFD
jgi:hypothetical protein